MQIETVQEFVLSNKIVWTKHVKERIKQRNVSKEAIIQGIQSGEIIEDYPNSYPFPSCLIWARISNDKVIHIVIGYDGDCVYVISVYIPDEAKFERNFKIRREL